MGTVGKCFQCRQNKQKCVPSGRIWVEDGDKQKCNRCEQYNHTCGPNECVPHRQPRRRGNFSQQQAPSLHRAGPSMASPDQRGLNNALVEDRPDLSGDDIGRGDDEQELRTRLGDLNGHVEAHKELQLAIEFLETNGRQMEPLYQDLSSLRNASTRELSTMLSLTEVLADRVYAACEKEESLYIYSRLLAEGAYTLILDVYRKLDIKAWHELRGLLRKMAKVFWNREPLRAENFLWQALELGFPRQAQEIDIKILKNLAKSLSRSSDKLSKIIQDMLVGHELSIPPLQRMMKSRYASQVVGNVFQTGSLAGFDGLTPIPPIVGGIEAIRRVVCMFSEEHMQAVDLLGRSPLFMATELRKENFGQSLLLRAAELAELEHLSLQRFTNTRDKSGQTILGIATWKGCSLQYIENLIGHGAEVDPETLMEYVFTPLQAASLMGREDIVDLLLRHGADPLRVAPNGQTAETLAHAAGHEGTVGRLHTHVGG